MSEAKTISDEDKKRSSKLATQATAAILSEGARTVSDADRKRTDEIGSSFKSYKKRRSSKFKGHF
jgi:hypothetical protein